MGTAYGGCIGEVLPKPDFCVTLTDDDCDGSPMPCVDNPTWSHAYGQPGAYNYVQRIATDSVGNVFVLAAANPSIDVGTGPIPNSILFKLDALGTLLWAKHLVDVGGGSDLAVDAAGDVVVGGFYIGSADFGGGPLPTSSGLTDFVVKFDAGGGHVWSKSLGIAGQTFPISSIALDPAGNVIIGGSIGSCVDFGNGQVCPQTTQSDLVVVKLTSTGAYVWHKFGGSPTNGNVSGVSCDSQGRVAIGGSAYPSADLGTGPLTANGQAVPIVAVLAPDGSPVFAKTIGEGGGTVQPIFDGFGGLLLAGDGTGVIDLGGGPVTPAQPNTGSDIWVGKLDATTGAHVWSHGLGNGLAQQYGHAATDGAGGLLVTGFFKGLVAMGGQFMQSYGGEDIFLASYDGSGVGTGGEHFGDAGSSQFGGAVAVDPFGARILGGYFNGVIDLGSGTLTSQGNWDAFIAKLPP
jgi:hypothetical protein